MAASRPARGSSESGAEGAASSWTARQWRQWRLDQREWRNWRQAQARSGVCRHLRVGREGEEGVPIPEQLAEGSRGLRPHLSDASTAPSTVAVTMEPAEGESELGQVPIASQSCEYFDMASIAATEPFVCPGEGTLDDADGQLVAQTVVDEQAPLSFRACQRARVRSTASCMAETLGFLTRGTVVEGWPEGRWLQLKDGAGFVSTVYDDGEVVLEPVPLGD